MLTLPDANLSVTHSAVSGEIVVTRQLVPSANYTDRTEGSDWWKPVPVMDKVVPPSILTAVSGVTEVKVIGTTVANTPSAMGIRPLGSLNSTNQLPATRGSANVQVISTAETVLVPGLIGHSTVERCRVMSVVGRSVPSIVISEVPVFNVTAVIYGKGSV